MEALPVPRSQSATIYEVARQAGVSIATVSRALRQSGPVSPKTRAKVEKAVAELGFLPSRAGVSLAEGRHAANGIVFPDLSGPYYAEVVLGYEEAASRLGQSVLILSTSGRDDVHATILDLAARVDGMVIFGRGVDPSTIEAVQASGLPVVLLARPALGTADSVVTESTDNAAALAEHLIGHGHRVMKFLGDPVRSPDVAARWESVAATLHRHKLPVRTPIRCGYDEECGRQAALKALRSPKRPDVLVCGNDEIALGAMSAAIDELGLRVPEDIAITGWDDVFAARHTRPGLTTVRQPMRELGERAATRLDELISGERAAPVHDVLPTQLVVRSSCGPHEEDAR